MKRVVIVQTSHFVADPEVVHAYGVQELLLHLLVRTAALRACRGVPVLDVFCDGFAPWCFARELSHVAEKLPFWSTRGESHARPDADGLRARAMEHLGAEEFSQADWTMFASGLASLAEHGTRLRLHECDRCYAGLWDSELLRHAEDDPRYTSAIAWLRQECLRNGVYIGDIRRDLMSLPRPFFSIRLRDCDIHHALVRRSGACSFLYAGSAHPLAPTREWGAPVVSRVILDRRRVLRGSFPTELLPSLKREAAKLVKLRIQPT